MTTTPSQANRLRSRPRPSIGHRLAIDDTDRPTGKEAGLYECIHPGCSEKAVYRIIRVDSDAIEFYCDGHISREQLRDAEYLGIEVTSLVPRHERLDKEVPDPRDRNLGREASGEGRGSGATVPD